MHLSGADSAVVVMTIIMEGKEAAAEAARSSKGSRLARASRGGGVRGRFLVSSSGRISTRRSPIT